MKRPKLRYPSNSNVEAAIANVISTEPWLAPEEFCRTVVSRLEESNFFCGHLSNGRVWRLFSVMVHRRQVTNPWGLEDVKGVTSERRRKRLS